MDIEERISRRMAAVEELDKKVEALPDSPDSALGLKQILRAIVLLLG